MLDCPRKRQDKLPNHPGAVPLLYMITDMCSSVLEAYGSSHRQYCQHVADTDQTGVYSTKAKLIPLSLHGVLGVDVSRYCSQEALTVVRVEYLWNICGISLYRQPILRHVKYACGHSHLRDVIDDSDGSWIIQNRDTSVRAVTETKGHCH